MTLWYIFYFVKFHKGTPFWLYSNKTGLLNKMLRIRKKITCIIVKKVLHFLRGTIRRKNNTNSRQIPNNKKLFK